jgi:hypothetical protein
VWESASASKAWTLTPGDGTKTVYYQIKDNAGWTSSTYSDTITLDTILPTGSIVINNGDVSTTSTSVSLTLTYLDGGSGVSQVRFSNDGVFDIEVWESALASKSWTLVSGDGTKTVYYQIKDNAGLQSITYTDTIIQPLNLLQPQLPFLLQHVHLQELLLQQQHHHLHFLQQPFL